MPTAPMSPSRAKLKIFFGYAPGVGKTYKMLELARELAIQGANVVVGRIESQARRDTSTLMLGLDFLPRRTALYRGVRLEELDLEAALARRPQVLLVDELAHTNAPGGRHSKRWQDVLDLLDAGIDVHTTLNVQHVESLNDIVAQITGARLRETVPDSMLERADEIELVDCSPDELLTRLAEGKVRLPEDAPRAAERLFERGNLLALRELALRTATEHVDADVQEYRKAHEVQATWSTRERLMVCVGPAPASERLVRAACRMAAGLHAPWVAAYVDSARLAPLAEPDRQRLESHLRLAESLGAEVVRLQGDRPSAAILDHARRHNVTRVIVGKPTHSRIRDLLSGSLLDDVIRSSGDIEVHVIAGDAGSDVPKDTARKPSRLDGRNHVATAALVGAATALGALLRGHLAEPDLVMLYLLCIGVVAARFGRGPSLLAATLSVLAYDFFFVPPFYTFRVADERHLLTFLMMFVVGVLTSSLTLRIRKQERDARSREERTAALYGLSRDLGSALDADQAALETAQHAADTFGGGAAVLLPEATGSVVVRARAGAEVAFGPRERAAAAWAFEHGRSAGLGTETMAEARLTFVPLESGPESLGVLALSAFAPDAEQRHFLDAFARQAALALERARLAEEAKAAALRARTEEMRSSLLSAVSHDLRTPLAAMTGAATTLRDRAELPPRHRAELLDTICEEAERLERLVRNLLDMTQLESGALRIKREWVPLEEVVGAALTRLDAMLAGRPITSDLPADLPLISIDPVLFGQLFVNLLENATKYTPAGTPIEIGARAAEGVMTIEVSDRGPGLPPGSERLVFEKFHRGRHTGVPGVGLGLAICRGIVQAHGGTLAAEHRAGGGATFRICLPQGGVAPAVPPEAEIDVAVSAEKSA